MNNFVLALNAERAKWFTRERPDLQARPVIAGYAKGALGLRVDGVVYVMREALENPDGLEAFHTLRHQAAAHGGLVTVIDS